VKAVDGVTFSLRRGRTMGLVGESGCGKSTTGRVLLKVLTATEGQIKFHGEDILHYDKAGTRRLRTQMQIVFQDPYSSLNPRLPVVELVGEAMLQHGIVKTRAEMKEQVVELIGRCGLFPEQAARYPHQISGGQRQRICIARALALNPEFVVCDEAVSALDVSIQSQIINLLKGLQEEMGLTYLFISHDLSVVKFISDDVGIMYLGQLVEMGSKNQVFDDPLHPYTHALLAAVPTFDSAAKSKKRVLLEGDIPSPASPPSGCRFHTRCPRVLPECGEEEPVWKDVGQGHFVMCHRVRNGETHAFL
jgi:oligopeptide/dipeptide ABC transporter ATP-binding protein